MDKITPELDLNIDNYDLDDILSLFHIDFYFDEADLRRVKKAVLHSHPDKSKLDKKYFLFFTSAYKILFSIYEFRNKSNTNQSTEYKIEKDEEKELLIKKLKTQSNFNVIFNDLFVKHKIYDIENDTGYGDWLKSDENIDTRTTTMNEMNDTFERKKKEVKELIVFQELEECGEFSNHFDLTRNKPSYYSSSLFSSLQYEDLKKAHVESVIPVNQEDYDAHPKYKNVISMQQDPNYQNTKPLSFEQSQNFLNAQKSLQTRTDVRRAYDLARQEETTRKTNLAWMSGFKQLT